MPEFTAPTLSAAQEANLETWKQVYEVLDYRKNELRRQKENGRIKPNPYAVATNEVNSLMENIAGKAKDLTGCPFGIWLDNQ